MLHSFFRHFITTACIFIFSDSNINAKQFRLNCLSRSAFCSQDPTLETQNNFCKILYPRDIEYLSECGPEKPGPICKRNVCNGTAPIKIPTPFDANRSCQAIQLIQSIINHNNQRTHVAIGTTPLKDVRYFYFLDQDSQWIVFLGSKTVTNWITDMRYGFVHVPQLNMSLHRGFFQATQHIYGTLKELISQNPNKKIRITGYSLGGAVATILAIMLVTENHTIDTLITFGQPQITDESGALTFNANFAEKVPLIRFINHHDIAPFLLQFFKEEYRQFGPEVRLENETDIYTFAILPESDNTQSLSSKDYSGLTDHQLVAYVNSLEHLFCHFGSQENF